MRLEWTPLVTDLKLRGPDEPLKLAAGERFRWGRHWRPAGSSKLSFLPMSSVISGRALEIWWQDSPSGPQIIVSTSQGGARSDGHVDVHGVEGFQHRLTERGTGTVPLRPGSYRIEVCLLDPLCRVDVELLTARPSSTPDERHTEAWWDLDRFFSDEDHAVYAVALLAVAATRLGGLRGDQSATRYLHDTLVPEVLGRKKDWANDRLVERVERRRIVLSPGAERIHAVAMDTASNLTTEQVDELEAWLRSRLSRDT